MTYLPDYVPIIHQKYKSIFTINSNGRTPIAVNICLCTYTCPNLEVLTVCMGAVLYNQILKILV